MPRLRHTANAGRSRVRLISTPNHHQGDPEMAATVNGMKYSDQLACLLDHAIVHDFRVEADPKHKPNGTVVYAPDAGIPPMRFSERGAKFNRAHYENLRRDLYRAGLPPLPADVRNGGGGVILEAESIEALVASGQIPDGHAVTDLQDVFATLADPSMSNRLVDMLADDEVAPAMLGILVEGLALRTLNEAHAGFLSALVTNTHRHLISYSEAAVAAAAESIGQRLGLEVTEALTMAQEAESRAEREAAAAAKADKREAKARADCAAALAEARVQKARADELEKALAPLRALLSSAS